MEFTVQGRIESRNTFDGYHWSKKAQYAERWKWRVIAAVGRREPPNEPRRATLTVYRNRLLDSDNLSGGCKQLRDALVHVGLLVDDSPKWSNWEYRQEKCPKGAERVDVEIH